ncbi:MAG: amidohydrolase family protein [Acidimicrobiia bacterium]
MDTALRVIDADGHTLEPSDWIVRYLDPKFRHRIQSEPDGQVLVDGQEVMRHPPRTLEALRFTPDLILERFGEIAEAGFSAMAVVDAMDVEGIDVSVIYGPLYQCWIEGMDPELAAAIARAYSRWLAEYMAESGGRIVGAAPIPLHDVVLALKEVEYDYHELGIRAFWTRPNPVRGRMLGHRDFDPFYEALEDLNVPLSFHEGSGSLMQNIGSERFMDTWFEQHVCVHPMEQQMAMLSLIVQGVLERHPSLRVAFMEAGSAWAPSWLHRMDEHAELVGWNDAPDLSLEPSEYFKRQCFISCEPDEDLLYQVVDALGHENVLFASDFPHPDAKYPTAVKQFLELPKVSTEVKAQILWDNALRFYGFDEDALPKAGASAGRQ